MAMQKVPVKNSEPALVDDEDYLYLMTFKWYKRNGYAHTTYHRLGASRADSDRNVNISMSRTVAGRSGLLSRHRSFVDHIDGNRLNNQRANLRAVTTQENNWNLASHRNGIKGVRLTPSGKYQVRLGNVVYGNYADRKTAELVYDKVATTIRGDFAVRLRPDENIPDDFLIPNLNKTTGAAEKSGVKGVVWFKARKCWRVIIKGKTIGYHATLIEAINARTQHED